MRRTALLLVVVAATAAVVWVAQRPGGPGADAPGPPVDPVTAARRAHAAAVAGPLLVTLVGSDGAELARARLDGDRAELAAAGLTGMQAGDRLSVLGETIEVAAPEPARLLAALVERPARWEGRHLRLDGSPAARAWLDGAGRLARLEIDLGRGVLLVVTPAP